ncbi:MAG: hypothetical protein ACE5EX_12290, partial [Phycisphaerae bacterium]
MVGCCPLSAWQDANVAIESTDCYRRNLAALTTFLPSVALTIEQTTVPDAVTAATGRDGSTTFLLPGTEGRMNWLGGSSMPTVSAPELMGQFIGDGSGVVLPGVLTGLEPLHLAEGTPAHTPIFVLEPEPLFAKLALHLYDYSALFERQRLVLILSPLDDLEEPLCAFFREHDGFELPLHLLPVPQRSTAEMARLGASIEEAGAAVSRLQSHTVESLTRKIARRRFGACPARPRVAVLSVDPRPVALEQAHRVERALAKLDWPGTLCIPDTPGRCHTVARLRAVDAATADAVILINGRAESLTARLPDELPIISWYFPEAIITEPRTARRPRELIVGSSNAVCRSLVAAGHAA